MSETVTSHLDKTIKSVLGKMVNLMLMTQKEAESLIYKGILL